MTSGLAALALPNTWILKLAILMVSSDSVASSQTLHPLFLHLSDSGVPSTHLVMPSAQTENGHKKSWINK